MLILVPWRPVVVAWGLLAAMLWVGYVGYSLLEGKNPFAIGQHHPYRFHTHSSAGHGTRDKSTPAS
jgi:hypothetical protein